ncbi:MAG: glycosyltransferase, partial [Methanocorpusculum sp.]|nr:glycosyltransferase [Methanocorpusculum sp.]
MSKEIQPQEQQIQNDAGANAAVSAAGDTAAETCGISVVIPAFNEGEGIEACLKSLCDQTLPRDRYEIIVVDGNSKDNTREVA